MADDGVKEEPIFARLRGKPGEPPAGLTSFVGLLGHSPRPGYWQLYTNLDMSRSVEIAESDIVHAEKLSPEKSPFGGLGGTRVFVKRDAQVTQTATQTHKASEAAPDDEFDLDIRSVAGLQALIVRHRTVFIDKDGKLLHCKHGTPNPDNTQGVCAQ
jgi:hypothetical protein